MTNINSTPFLVLYNRFLGKITDDLYLELTKEDTYNDLESILLSAIPLFEFPRFALFNYDLEQEFTDDLGNIVSKGAYLMSLTHEEVDILTDCMLIEWLKRQISSVENIRMKYSGSDFKFTSQANHLDKLMKLRKDYETQNRHKQRLYKRRKISNTGEITSNLSSLVGGVFNGNNN